MANTNTKISTKLKEFTETITTEQLKQVGEAIKEQNAAIDNLSKKLENAISSINTQKPQTHEGLSKAELKTAVNQYVSDFSGKFAEIMKNYLATFITATVPSIGAIGRMNLRRNKEKRISELCINMFRRISPTARSRRSRIESGMRKGRPARSGIANSCRMKIIS